MKTILTTLNSKYIHTSLALRYLMGYGKQQGIENLHLHEYTINHHMDEVVAELYQLNGDIYCFSCYIFNMVETVRVIADLKKIMPHAVIVVGGPEVTFGGLEFMKSHPEVDYVILGEGEVTFADLMKTLHNKLEISEVKGILYRKAEEIVATEERELICDLDEIPFAYEEELEGWENQILYYESSRGCPYRCQYCLSSTLKGVRFFSLERVFSDLEKLITAKVKQVKFVDRTFNCDRKRTLALWKFLVEKDNGVTNFHFEMAADLINEEMLAFLKNVRPGLFQFEIGVQSTHKPTLEAIQRTISFSKLSKAVVQVQGYGNIHQHLDLIAGLPHEDYDTFQKSFNDVYGLKSDMIQLGFLKLLKGAGIRENSQEYGYVYSSYPPYEVLQNDYISFGELQKLKKIEEVVDKYYNSGLISYTLNYLETLEGWNPFAFFEDFSSWWVLKGFNTQSHKPLKLVDYLYQYFEEGQEYPLSTLVEFLKFDILRTEKVIQLPLWWNSHTDEELHKKILDFYWDEDWIEKNVRKLQKYSPKQRSKVAHIEGFLVNPYENKREKELTFYLFVYSEHKKSENKSDCYEIIL